jgi:hypothetical protein
MNMLCCEASVKFINRDLNFMESTIWKALFTTYI